MRLSRKRKQLLSVILSLAILFSIAPIPAYALGCPAPGSAAPPAVARHTLYDDLGSAFSDYMTSKLAGGSLGELEGYFNYHQEHGRGFNLGGRELNSGKLGDLFGKAGKAFDLASLAKDVAGYTDSSRHKHESLEFLDNVFRGWAIGLSLVKEVPIAGDAMGILRDLFGGESVSDFFNGINKGDNAFLDTMDSLVNSMNLSVQDFYFMVDAMWSDFYNWLMELVGPGQDGEVQVEKPNIYLYSEVPTEASVVFSRPDLLLTTIPLYDSSGGWRVVVQGDGPLMVEGIKHDFLFYESSASPADFQTQEGFYVEAENRTRQFNEILDAYGFNQQEKDDFIAYWTERLDPGQDYAMYPQGGERLDAVMPLIVNPAPDHVNRLWFGFEATKEIPAAPEIVPFERGGFTVVEWGGSVLTP